MLYENSSLLLLILQLIFFIQDNQGRELVDITNIALEKAIAACGPGRPFKDIGKAIHNFQL